MLTFPSLSLKFRKAGFPRYGFKAGRSGRAFPATPKLRVGRFASALRALRFRVSAPLCVGGRPALEHPRASGFCRSTPGALAPVRVILSRSIHAYSAPSAPLVGTSRFHRPAAYTRCPRCASPPRRPTTGSVLSLASSIDMSPSGTPGSSSAARTQFFANDSGLRPVRKVSALPLTPTLRFSWGDAISELHYGLLSLRPVDLLAPLSELTGTCPSQRGLLLPGFRRIGHPHRRRI
jgi:hypothetical protein